MRRVMLLGQWSGALTSPASKATMREKASVFVFLLINLTLSGRNDWYGRRFTASSPHKEVGQSLRLRTLMV
jgi:hypothetical protein